MKHFDYADLSDRMIGDEKNIREVLLMCRDYLVKLPALLEEVSAKGDLAKLNKLGHSIKGIAATASFYRLSDMGRQLQDLKSWDENSLVTLKKEILVESEKLQGSIDLVL
ncbi:MAG: Hpt domain-containing protein [Leptospira sp.]|nr:Hpt domain-containing protein [Leptospira sp.]